MMGGFLYQSPELQLILIFYSFIVGIAIGVIYSIFDTISITLNLYIEKADEYREQKLQNKKNKIIISKIFQFSIDFLFSVVYTVIAVVFVFCANRGKFRFFLMFFSLVGFVLYMHTVGRLVSFCMQRTFSFVYRLIKTYVVTPVYSLYTVLKLRFVSADIRRRVVDTVIRDKDF